MADWKKIGKGFALGGPAGAAVVAHRARTNASDVEAETRSELPGNPSPPPADQMAVAGSDQAFTARGRNGQLTVTPTKIIISREGTMGFLSQGHKGQKEIDLRQISSIQLKKNGRGTVGYIQFAFVGGSEAKHGINQAVKDENTVLFAKKVEPDFLRAKELIDSYRDRLQTGVTTSFSAAAELEKFAQLLRDGVLTDEEFTGKKRELLGL